MIRRSGSIVLAGVVLLAVRLDAQPVQPAYADSATAALVAQARARHLRQDSLVHDYQAAIRTRIDVRVGPSRFARMVPLVVHETAATVSWQRPDDLKLTVLGTRSQSAFGPGQASVLFRRPWFIPRALGDSIRLMGVPETAALHPLAANAEPYYRYAIRDSVVMSLPGRRIRAIAVRVEPSRLGPSLVAGDMWVDAASGDVVRLRVTFLGEFLWHAPEATREDSASARNDSRWAQRFLTVQADLEYALYENRYWMPYRQLLQILVEADILLRGAMPVRSLTEFEDYQINAGGNIAFTIPLEDIQDEPQRRYRDDERTDSTSRG